VIPWPAALTVGIYEVSFVVYDVKIAPVHWFLLQRPISVLRVLSEGRMHGCVLWLFSPWHYRVFRRTGRLAHGAASGQGGGDSRGRRQLGITSES